MGSARTAAPALIAGLASALLVVASAAAPAAAPARLAAGADGAWNEVPPPIGRDVLLYDAPRQRLIILGGSNDDNPAGVWVLPLTGTPKWTFVPTTGSHSQLGNLSAVYDSPRDRVVVFGTDASYNNALWALSLSTMTWAPLTPAGTPPSWRIGSMTVFDPVRDRMILFGGGEGGGMSSGPQYNDVWALSLGDSPAWTQLQPAGPPPMGRQYAACIYDPVRDRMVIFGGLPDWSLTNYTDLNDFWALSLGGTPTWTQLQPSGTLPNPEDAMGAVYDPVRDRMVSVPGTGITSGNYTTVQTFSLDLASLQLTILSPTGSPRGGGPAAAYDPPNDRYLTYGGGSVRAMALSTLVWSGIVPSAGAYPDTWWDFVMCNDAARGQVLLTGGLGENDYFPYFANYLVYAYEPGTSRWKQPLDLTVPYLTRPKARSDHSAVVDDARSRLILFGGFEENLGAGNYGNDTWAMTLSGPVAWSQLAPAGTPPSGRASQSTIVDPGGDRMVIFGGTDGTTVLNDVWALQFAGPQWVALGPTGTPPPARQRAAAFYDPLAERMIVFGGTSKPGVPLVLGPSPAFNDLWALNLTGSPVWAQLSPTGTPPPPTASPIAVFDPDRNRAEILTDGGVWALNLTDPPSWEALDISGSPIGTLGRGAAVYDPAGHRVLARPGMTEVLWELDFTSLPTAVEVSVARAEAAPDHVSLEWLASTPALQTAIQRSVAGGPWETRASVTADARGRIAYEDPGVSAGIRYGYRLGFPDGGSERTAGEVWVSVPAPALALRGAVPNPAGPEVAVGFSLPAAGPARLELLDLAGRRLVSREVGTLGAGPHVVSLAGSVRLAPGIYLLRLTHAGRSLVTRIAVLR